MSNEKKESLRNRLNEYQLDYAQAAVRSQQIPLSSLKRKKILIIGEQADLDSALTWSFQAWNEEKGAGLQVRRLVYPVFSSQWEEKEKQDLREETILSMSHADYIILTGCSTLDLPNLTVRALTAALTAYDRLFAALEGKNFGRILLLSDGRVYGRLSEQFAASEYEQGQNTGGQESWETALLCGIENSFLSHIAGKEQSWGVLRLARLLGAGFTPRKHAGWHLAGQTAEGEKARYRLTAAKSSYISIHDVLTAVQFHLTCCPDHKILNVKGASADASDCELVMCLYQNFPDACRIDLYWEEKKDGEDFGCLLNTQQIEKYGYQPAVTLEDALIILVKSLQKGQEVFIFDHTYMGKLTTVQQILLGYLLEIDRICRKHQIRYFLAGGTLLGAIRHHGFIPWDDDADVMMLREDFDRFMQVAPQELPDNIFVQIPETEKGNYNPFTKLRIDNTLFATEFTGHFPQMHNGIFFDILSHDQTGNHRWSQKLHLMGTMLARSVVFNKWGNTNIKSGGSHPLICKVVDHAKYLVPMPFAVWVQERALRFFQKKKTGYLYDGMGRNLKRGAFPKKWLEEVTYVPFEGYSFPVPKEYDRYLTWLYGDYMQMIPVSSRRTSHSIVLTDLGEYSAYHAPKSGGKV